MLGAVEEGAYRFKGMPFFVGMMSGIFLEEHTTGLASQMIGAGVNQARR
jgi:hypothetical protein